MWSRFFYWGSPKFKIYTVLLFCLYLIRYQRYVKFLLHFILVKRSVAQVPVVIEIAWLRITVNHFEFLVTLFCLVAYISRICLVQIDNLSFWFKLISRYLLYCSTPYWCHLKFVLHVDCFLSWARWCCLFLELSLFLCYCFNAFLYWMLYSQAESEVRSHFHSRWF